MSTHSVYDAQLHKCQWFTLIETKMEISVNGEILIPLAKTETEAKKIK